MYALTRNTCKFKVRDKRQNKIQHIESDALAPDTVEEIFHARTLLELWTGKARLRNDQKDADSMNETELIESGRKLLQGSLDQINDLEILGENMEKSRRKVVILKAYDAYRAYGRMLHHYAVKNLLDYLKDHPEASLESMHKALRCEREKDWVNLGGQIVPARDVDRLRADIGSGRLASWEAIHKKYDAFDKAYPLAKQRHAYATLLSMLNVSKLTVDLWHEALDRAVEIQNDICDQVYESRQKDFDNFFRQITYRNLNEMKAVVGTAEGNDFIKQVREETSQFKKTVSIIKKAM